MKARRFKKSNKYLNLPMKSQLSNFYSKCSTPSESNTRDNAISLKEIVLDINYSRKRISELKSDSKDKCEFLKGLSRIIVTNFGGKDIITSDVKLNEPIGIRLKAKIPYSIKPSFVANEIKKAGDYAIKSVKVLTP